MTCPSTIHIRGRYLDTREQVALELQPILVKHSKVPVSPSESFGGSWRAGILSRVRTSSASRGGSRLEDLRLEEMTSQSSHSLAVSWTGFHVLTK